MFLNELLGEFLVKVLSALRVLLSEHIRTHDNTQPRPTNAHLGAQRIHVLGPRIHQEPIDHSLVLRFEAFDLNRVSHDP